MYVCMYVCMHVRMHVCMRNLPANVNQAELCDTRSCTPNQIMDVTALTHQSTSLQSITSFPFSFAHIERERGRGRETDRLPQTASSELNTQAEQRK